MNFNQGEIFAINKPYGMTSFGALARVRKLISVRLGVKRVKIGHAGTLDPLATGVLVLCTGRATKRIEELQRHDKEYTATLQLGATTPSYDMEHEVNATYPTDGITLPAIERALAMFVGDIAQVPPTYSACKVNGVRSYDLRRNGMDVELAAKRVRIDAIDIIEFDEPAMRLSIRVSCGKGTYIRALARDIGRALGTGAYLTSLCRTKAGDFSVANSIALDDFPQWLQGQEIETDTEIPTHK